MNYLKPGSILIALILFLSVSTIHVNAQSSSIPQNLSTINVNDLTDAQIRQYMSQASAAGLSDAQLMQQAQSRGMPEDQIQLLQKRV
ncbi:MAG: kpsD, partial [Mucilaginibacter sp.]|nr:kpsD [Mucilaginibacter sp.]